MAEAERRDEGEWNEHLENESVRSLSRYFYESFAKGHYAGDDGKTAHNDNFFCSSSVGSLTIGECSSTTEHTHPRPPFASSSSSSCTPRKERTRRGIFDLSRAFRDLRACSSSQTVIPVRLGRTLPLSSEATPPAVLKTPIPPPYGVVRSARACGRRHSLRQSTTGKTIANVPTTAPTTDVDAPSEVSISGGTIPGGLIFYCSDRYAGKVERFDTFFRAFQGSGGGRYWCFTCCSC